MNDLQLVIETSERRAAEISRLNKRIAKLERVLRMVEFGGEWELQWCHWCRKMSNINDTNDLHAPDCPRQAVLNE